MQVYELITCVQKANENAGYLISVVQFLIIMYIHSNSNLRKFRTILPFAGENVCSSERFGKLRSAFVLIGHLKSLNGLFGK